MPGDVCPCQNGDSIGAGDGLTAGFVPPCLPVAAHRLKPPPRAAGSRGPSGHASKPAAPASPSVCEGGHLLEDFRNA